MTTTEATASLCALGVRLGSIRTTAVGSRVTARCKRAGHVLTARGATVGQALDRLAVAALYARFGEQLTDGGEVLPC